MIVAVVITLGLVVFPSGPFIRPHPVFWRLVFGAGVCYSMVLIILLFSSKSMARFSLTLLWPELNVPLEERDYAADCSFTWANLSEATFDRYFVAHFLGWVFK